MPENVIEAEVLNLAHPSMNLQLRRPATSKFIRVQLGDEEALVEKDALLIAAKAVCEEDER